MAKDYSAGRYNVYQGRGPSAPLIGRIDEDEFVRSNGKLIYRVDGDEFYDMSGNFIGSIVEVDGVGLVIGQGQGGETCHFMIMDE
ncbi:hypothetical protein CDR19_04150 [Ectopseudomonas toyotomiensis]|uniref:Uncharacterized protein n=1 Tax=Ectopseudomonas toyotomiensis TaxID=554344 RepID=A0A1I5QZ02_9GAMM|nr:hypothetical protein [Pseudomonas toyotomiensis]PIA74264.1 hypothetical protein CDR19_04150 [Pseudomonas toyotomiensis]SFP51473.1 hypothetical protein SAMN05216177_103205 [Pseudomonas toyotomiensis]